MTLTFPWGARTTILLKPWTWGALTQKAFSFPNLSPCPFLFCLFIFPSMAGQGNHSPSSCTMETLASNFFRLLRLPFQKVPGWRQSWGLLSEAVDLRCQNAPMYRQSMKAAELAVGVVGWWEHIWSCKLAVMWEQRKNCFIPGVQSSNAPFSFNQRRLSFQSRAGCADSWLHRELRISIWVFSPKQDICTIPSEALPVLQKGNRTGSEYERKGCKIASSWQDAANAVKKPWQPCTTGLCRTRIGLSTAGHEAKRCSRGPDPPC